MSPGPPPPASSAPLAPQSKKGQLLAVGRAREGGIEVEGKSKLLGFTAFEDVAGSGYHRPALHTHTAAGRNLQELQLAAAGVEAGGGAGVGSRTRQAQQAEQPPPVELLEDENDDLCHICGLGVSTQLRGRGCSLLQGVRIFRLLVLAVDAKQLL